MKCSTPTPRCALAVGIAVLLTCALGAQNLVWNFDEAGAPTRAYDSSGNGNIGVVRGNVTSDAAGGFTGFTSADSHVFWSCGERRLGRKSATLAMWIKNPGMGGANGRVTLAGVGELGNALRAWELWLGPPDPDGKRTLNLSWSSWEDKSGVLSGDAKVLFEPDIYYYLAFSWAGANGYYPYTVRAYLAKEGDEAIGEPILAGRVGGGGGPTGSNVFYVGASGGVRLSFFKTGFFGGSIGMVSLWLDGAVLDAGALNHHFLSTAPLTVNETILRQNADEERSGRGEVSEAGGPDGAGPSKDRSSSHLP